MTTPDWVQDSIFYQIFPDRFANGDPANDPPNVKSWGSPPTIWDFQGGDLRGISQRLDYLQDLGVNAIYLTPIFQSASTHRYNTTNYYEIDPSLGKRGDFTDLLNAVHHKKMRLILDGVFNHCGRGFFAFVDVLENNEHSPYRDWFHIQHLPLEAYTPGEANNYLAWWKFKSLPKLNARNPQVRQYIFDVARYWIEQGIDGWRLDVPNEIDDDAFWEEFRSVVKSANPEAYLLGEIWTADPRWANDKHFDGLMNYPLRETLLAVLQGREKTPQFASRLDELFSIYPLDNVFAMYLPLGTHDTERISTILGNNLEKTRLAFMLQFSLPGAPAIYYGDEIGLEGGKDPDNRRAFPWDRSQWKNDLHSWVKTLAEARRKHPALRRGEFTRLLAGDGFYAIARRHGREKILAAFNFSGSAQRLQIPPAGIWKEGAALKNLLDNQTYKVEGGVLSLGLPAWSGIWAG